MVLSILLTVGGATRSMRATSRWVAPSLTLSRRRHMAWPGCVRPPAMVAIMFLKWSLAVTRKARNARAESSSTPSSSGTFQAGNGSSARLRGLSMCGGPWHARTK